MGNQHSTAEGDARQARAFGRNGNLGLSRSELDKRCQPSGLYDTCHWDERAIRKLVGDGKLAARSKGKEDRTDEFNQECPICFLYYPDTNITKCCSANICTECYLQVRPQKEKQSTCPFCNNHKLSVTIAKKPSADQLEEREKEEQTALEARIRAREGGGEGEGPEADGEEKSENSEGFGSSLMQDSRVAMMRKRSESIASSDKASDDNLTPDDNMIHSFAMTAEERRRLEDEMKAQHSHPLALRLEAEAAERRVQNDRAYYRSHSGTLRTQRVAELFRSGGSRRRGRGPGGRDWNQIVDAFERGGNGQIQSLDDLVVLEAAILLSMDEDSRRARNGDDGTGDFDAARHARDGFPLVRSLMANRREDGGAGATPDQVQHLPRGLHPSRRRNQLLRAGYAGSRMSSDSALDTAALLMRGVSEEEQLAMAIAASLHDQSNGSNEDGSNNEGADTTEVATRNGERAAVGVVIEEGSNEPAGGAQNGLAGGSEGAQVALGIPIDEQESTPDPPAPQPGIVLDTD